MSHVFLIGFMGAGKSTVGPMLAAALGRAFVDLDDAIAAREGESVAQIFAADGEQRFRELEVHALESLRGAEPLVIACGGGIVTTASARMLLRELGACVYLKTTADEALRRIKDTKSRPLLAGADATEAAERLLGERTTLYSEAADIEIDTDGITVPVVTARIITVLEENRTTRMKPVVVRVPIEGSSYEVVIGPGVLRNVADLVSRVSRTNKVAIVTDGNVASLFGTAVESDLSQAGFTTCLLTVAPGESSKSWPVAGDLLESLAEFGLDRDDLIIALGGGVVGDLGGFVAATFLRGIRFVQVPTTLLAQVDSSVGGKTGVDLRAGKNLAGAFKQPLLVIADTATLSSLPEKEWASGLAEIAKSAIIDGEEFLGWLEDHAAALRAREPVAVEDAVARCVAFKSRVVSADEKEEGLRECLNYGHTLGHAIENVAGYGVIPHGLAVAEGIRFAARLAVEVAGAPASFVRRQDALLDALGLFTLPGAWPLDELTAAMHSDKKARSGTVRFVLADRPGSWTCSPVSDRTIGEHLTVWATSKGVQTA